MIAMHNVNKFFGQLQALKDISGIFQQGTVTVLCGPSGSGKSTLIRTINRLEEIDSGRITVDGRDIHDCSLNVDRFRMGLGFVFQQFNLFPHLTVIDNITLAPRKLKGMAKDEAEQLASDLLRRVKLSGKERAYPENLSGGQAQRVAIARCLAMRPKIMLFDEPTSALDPEMISEVLAVMGDLASEGMTMVCVTHEMGFARSVADAIWFLEAGRKHGEFATDDFFQGTTDARIAAFLSHLDRQ
jgi:polar amino acid transport system ATP-binding protein